MLVPIDRADDPALAPYLLLRERDLVGREGLFVAEGEVVLRVLATESAFRIRSLLLEERRVESVRDIVERIDAPAYVVPQRIMDGVVGFAIHRGVLAIGERGPALDPRAIAESGLTVGLVGLTNHDNVGGIFRNAAAFGARVLLDAETCDPLYRKAIRVSAGNALVVPFARCASATALLDLLAEADVEPIALTPRGEVTIDELPPRARRCLLLGTEGPGLSDAILARARGVRIDIVPSVDSLNVSVAAGIALHAEFRRRSLERG